MESDSDGPPSPSGSLRLAASRQTWDASPSSSTNLNALASQLEDIHDLRDRDAEWTCCCNGSAGSSGCRSEVWREGMEEKLKLAGEVGQALLERYESLEQRHVRDKEKWKSQLDVKSKSLEAAATRIHNLEKANATHMSKYAEMSRKQEALEKRYTQALHTQTLTQTSLTHVRAELTTLRKTSNRQSIALASGQGFEDRLGDAERRLEEARDAMDAESKKAKDEARHRKRAEARILELEALLAGAKKELEEVKEGRTKDAQDLLNNAKERLELLHAELSETFSADSPEEMPEYQKALESLVADNALLRHDTTELSHRLAEARDENRVLQQEVDDLRTVIATSGRTSPQMYASLAGEVRTAQHHRTESTPLGGPIDRGWARMSIARPPLDHNRRSSMAPSWTSTASTADGGLVSPGLGLGSIGEYDAPIVREAGSLSPTLPSEGRQSPKSGILRMSPSGASIGYVLNGVPKRPGARPAGMRRISMEVTSRIPSAGIEAILERQDSASDSPEEPLRSPGSIENYRAAEHSRKRRSLMLSRRATMSPTLSEEYSRALANTDIDEPRPTSPMSDSAVDAAVGPSPAKKIHRRTLMLLSKSKGVQTDSLPDPPRSLAQQVAEMSSPTEEHPRHIKNLQSITSVGTSPLDERSETSSIHDRSSMVVGLVDHISRMLARLRAADIPTLNKRLRKHNLPSDVGHLSRTTMKALQADIADLRLGFKGIPESSFMSRREFNLLVKLLKDIFAELIDLQETVNNVTIDPKLAKKLRAEAFRAEDEDAAAAAAGGGLGWIAAPITKFFVTPAAEPEVPEAPTLRGRQERDRSKLAAGTVRVPKQAPVASATTTHVSIEFGGTGIVRRAVPAGPNASGLDATEGPRSSEGSRVVSASSTNSATTTDGLAEQVDGNATLRPAEIRRAKSRANRNELLGIFAGATRPISPTGGQNWVVLPDPVPGPKLRSSSSRHFKGGEPTPIAHDAIPPMPPIHRSLHKRGLSDSSIRSTFVSHGEDLGSGIIGSAGTIEAGPAVSGRQGAYGAQAYGGVFGAISRRWYGKPVEPTLKDPNILSTPIASLSESKTKTKVEPIIAITSPSPSGKPIPVSPMRQPAVSTLSTSPSPRHLSASAGGPAGGGLLGYLASSLSSSAAAGNATSDEETYSEDEMIGATLRHQGMMRGRRTQSRRA